MKTLFFNSSIIFFLILFFVFYTACTEKEPFLNDSAPISKSRTILVYLGTDNNFSTEASEKVNTLTENWDNDLKGNLVVYSDTGKESVLVHIYYTKRYGNIADTIAIYPSENSASPTTFSRILNTVKEYFPAASYGLIVLSHATGWLPAEMSEPSPSLKTIILDKTTSETDNYMELIDFASAIPYKLDFIIFDACFMGAIEVSYELKEKVDYIVASPTEVLSPGFPYNTMMRHLFMSDPELIEVARKFYECYNNKSGLYRSATVSVIKTAELANLAAFIRNTTIRTYNLESINNLQTFGFRNQKIYFDLGDFLLNAYPENFSIIQMLLERCVMYKACTPFYYSIGTEMRHYIRTFSGLSVYIPQSKYPRANEIYAKLKWSKDIHGENVPIWFLSP